MENQKHSNQKILIFSAPSGSGKTTIVRHLLAQNSKLAFSISATTRVKRAQETNGIDYYFLSKEDFQKKIEANEFVEWEQVYEGSFYGTLHSEVERIWDKDKVAVFDVDVQGALKLKKYYQEKALAVFVKVPSVEELRKRLLARKTETPATLAKRIAKAESEMSYEKDFDVSLINYNLEQSFADAEKIVQGFLGEF